jgi:opacity protein-like surface antigen
VKTIAWTLAALASLTAVASAQEDFTFDNPGSSISHKDRTSSFLSETEVQNPYLETEKDLLALPRSLSATEQGGESPYTPFSLGASAGYLRARGADQGTWFGGVQARMRFGLFAAEASIQFHQNKYDHGDVVVTQYPVQLTAFLYLIPEGPFRPYILGGVGWYYTHVDYRGIFSALNDHTEHIFGEHLGAGAELFLSPRVSIDGDVRYIFLNPKTDQVIHRDFNYWQITVGLNLFF